MPERGKKNLIHNSFLMWLIPRAAEDRTRHRCSPQHFLSKPLLRGVTIAKHLMQLSASYPWWRMDKSWRGKMLKHLENRREALFNTPNELTGIQLLLTLSKLTEV